MKIDFLKAFFFVTVLCSQALSAISLDPNEVRPWNKDEKKQFPTPLAAIFKKEDRSLIFVGDHHVDQATTFRYLEDAIKAYSPEIIVVEGLDFIDGTNPKAWMDQYISKSKEELLKELGAAPIATQLAFSKKIPLIGGEPSIEESMKSSFLLSKGFDKDDILNVQVLQRLPYRRDVLKLPNLDVFLDYVMKLYRVQTPKAEFKAQLLKWYKKKTGKDLNYETLAKSEVAVNCEPNDTFLQSVACAFNVNRDRALVENIGKLLQTHKRVLVVYGTGHFVQEYPAFVKGFGKAPEYFKVDP